MNKPSALLAGCALMLAGCTSAAAAPTGKAFAVAPPAELLFPISGPAPLDQGPCQAKAVSATARTKRANDGVLGIITLVGHSCSLAVNPAGIRLLDSSGRSLAVSTTRAQAVNPASS